MNELSPEREQELRALAKRLGFPMRDVTLFDRALTHASSLTEATEGTQDYESLEFLGDAVLGLAVAHHLFELLPDRTPGEYSRLRAGMVNRKVAARVGMRLHLAPVIRLGKGEESSGGRERAGLIGDCLEALIGALYLDGGWDTARAFVERVFRDELQCDPNQERVWDFKSRLQTYCQSLRIALPVFEVTRSEGPDHQKEFEVRVLLRGEDAGVGRGRSKKEAQQNAAKAALEKEGHHFE